MFRDLPFPRQTQTPVSKILKRVDTANTGSVMSISKHHKKVTHREYEVETNDGRTITKRRKTRIMFEDPSKHKKMNTSKARRTPKIVLSHQSLLTNSVKELWLLSESGGSKFLLILNKFMN
ncbi:synaptonemal complex protein 1-like [Euphorbia lathyris]|uniref:synaptonemal complex protein 1-like n=1 Tax=Euphorbia lathyris TaxID=212925 RepID=UPI003313EE8C